MIILSVKDTLTDALYRANDDLTGLAPYTVDTPPEGIKKLSVADTGSLITVPGEPGDIVLYNSSGARVMSSRVEGLCPSSVCVSAAGRWYYIASDSGTKYLFTIGMDGLPSRLTALHEEYSSAAFDQISGKIILLSYKSAQAVLFDPADLTMVRVQAPSKIKYGTGACSDARGYIYYFTPADTIIKCHIPDSSPARFVKSAEGIVWNGVSDDGYVPCGSPACGPYGSLFIAVSSGRVLKYSDSLAFEGSLPVSSVKDVSYGGAVIRPDTLVLPDPVQFGEVPVSFNNVEKEMTMTSAGITRKVELTASGPVIMSCEPGVWGSSAVITDLPAGGSAVVKIRLRPEGPAEFTYGIDAVSESIRTPKRIEISGKGVLASSFVIPIVPISDVPGPVADNIQAVRTSTSRLQKNVAVTANFVE